jgi:hypothetical protein
LVFSIIQIAKAITELMHGLKEVGEAKENLTFQSTAAVVPGSSRGGRLSAGQVTEQGQR